MSDLPERTIPPRDQDDFDHDFDPDSQVMRVGALEPTLALVSDDPALAARLGPILAAAGHALHGADAVARARVVLADGRGGWRGVLSRVREQAKPDAAVVLVLDAASPDEDALHALGVFACVREPIVAAEVLVLVSSALDAGSAKRRVADLSRRLDLEAHLASIGRISAGLSHELNTPLAVAQTNLDVAAEGVSSLLAARAHLLRIVTATPEHQRAQVDAARAYLASSADPEDVLGAMRDAVAALARIRALSKTMRELVRLERRSLTPVDLALTAERIHRWATSQPRARVELAVDEPITVSADPMLLEQILVNLVTNAADAVASVNAPRLRLHVYRAGRSGVISVRDNGPGIRPEEQERIFEPFYTTRRDRGGMGLGLALCREYAVRMGATLSLWSVPGRGACFRVRMPLA